MQTDGHVIHWAGCYDFLLKIITLGREGLFRERIIQAARLEPGQRILDVGCGTGTLALAAQQAVGAEGSVHGVDPAPEMIARARKKAAGAGSPAKLDVAAIEALPFPEGSMDIVMSTLVFHHLPEHLKSAGLLEIRRVLAPGGRVLLVDFGEPEGLEPKVWEAGFGTTTSGQLGPRFLFWLSAENAPE